MRKVSGMMLALVGILAMGSILVAEDAKWFDMENCQMCKPMMETEGFMENVKWETYPIANGIIDVTTVNEGFEEKYKTAHGAMMANWEKLQAGEEMKLCGMCQAFSAAMDETVKMETVKTNTGEISLTTSSNAETVAKLQEIAKRNAKEMAAMMTGGEGHEGHAGEGEEEHAGDGEEEHEGEGEEEHEGEGK